MTSADPRAGASDQGFWPGWLDRQKATVAKLALGPSTESIGRVESFADGVAFVSGLQQARLNELLRFENGSVGFVTVLDVDRIGAVLLDESQLIEAGSKVVGLGETARVPVGPGLLGRVIDPLGRPLDDGAPVIAEAFHPVEREAPSIIERDLVNEPVATGLIVIDSMFSIGRGQRELILGDRATGKTSIAVDTILSQKRSDIICVYVAVGQRATAVERVIDAVRAHGAPEKTIFVVASASSPPGLQWIAPFAGFAVAEYFRDRGGHALIVLDDLTKHAATHRELALLIREPPGREAYSAMTPSARASSRARVQAREVQGRRIADGAADRGDGCWQSFGLYTDLISSPLRMAKLSSMRAYSPPISGPRWTLGSA
ncbi:MAG: hypothetical protein U1E25_15770 [Methylocystis sp.]